jgi:aspartyl-tRNA(Asn)/glutamyl-tRNA(Gln) amidotransferase subunit B
MAWETVIGLEVHAHLLTQSKMFCGCSTTFGGSPNSRTCPVCLAMPGVLPVPNPKAVELALRMAAATRCEIRPLSLFARKHYFYPDLPKGYQISQYEQPLAEHGRVEIESHTIRIRRIHLEEDAGKSVHDEAYVAKGESMVDLNRSGTPLIEIVTEPDIQTPHEAALFLTKLRRWVRWLGVCDGNMEEGSLRCDANISLRPEGSDKLGIKTELKNMNSFRSVERALEVEIGRQTRILDSGGTIRQETLLWDESSGTVASMRGKEEAHDYHYFPDPDLVPLVIQNDVLNAHRDPPELPEDRLKRFVEVHGLPEYDAGILADDRDLADYADETIRLSGDAKAASNWIMGELLRIMNETKKSVREIGIRPEGLAELIGFVQSGKVSHSAAKKVFEEASATGEKPESVINRLGLVQVSDASAIDDLIRQVLDGQPGEVQKWLAGKESLTGFFVGMVMKASKGKANPALVNERVRQALEARRSGTA